MTGKPINTRILRRPSEAGVHFSKVLQLGKLFWCETNSGIHNPLGHVEQCLACSDKWTLSPSKLLGQAFVFYAFNMLAALLTHNSSSPPTKKVYYPRSVGISKTVFFKCDHVGGRLSETKCRPSVRDVKVRVVGLGSVPPSFMCLSCFLNINQRTRPVRFCLVEYFLVELMVIPEVRVLATGRVSLIS